jgi:hypothetical protein
MTDVSDVPIFDDGDEEEVDSKPVVSASKKEWYDMILHPNFLKALALATIAIVAVSLSPLSTHIKARVAALENVPHAEQVINAVLSAFIITFLRPPMDAV